MAQRIIVYGRDIPAQVIVRQGRTAEKRELPERFIQAVDRCAMRVGARDSDAYLAEWRRGDPEPVGDDLKAEADAAHKRFQDPSSDFLTLLRLWDAIHDEWESLRTQSRRRKFCRDHFLSYARMREWRDIHSQLMTVVAEHQWPINTQPASYEQIHQAMLSGLLGNITLWILPK